MNTSADCVTPPLCKQQYRSADPPEARGVASPTLLTRSWPHGGARTGEPSERNFAAIAPWLQHTRPDGCKLTTRAGALTSSSHARGRESRTNTHRLGNRALRTCASGHGLNAHDGVKSMPRSLWRKEVTVTQKVTAANARLSTMERQHIGAYAVDARAAVSQDDEAIYDYNNYLNHGRFQ